MFSGALLNSKSTKDKVQHFAPIWLEEIQNNKIYQKYSERNQKLEEGKENPASEQTKDVDLTDETEIKEESQATASADEKENSRTESDQDC